MIEIECLAAYIEMMLFTIITDHVSLKWLMSLKVLSGRLDRWSLVLQAYHFKIEHQKWPKNIMENILSRAPMIKEITREELLDFESTEFKSQENIVLMKHIMENQAKLSDIKIQDGMIFKRVLYQNDLQTELQWKLCLPTAITHEVMVKAHESLTSAHGGVTQTLERIKRFFYWPRMTFQVRRHVENCQICNHYLINLVCLK